MSTDDPGRERDVGQASDTAASVAASLIPEPFIAATLTAAQKALARKWAEDKKKDFQQFWNQLERELAGQGIDPALIAEQDERSRRTVYEMFNRAMGATHPDAQRPIARLTCLLVQQNYTPDRFTRSAGRLLQDVTGAELDALAKMLRASCNPSIPAAASHAPVVLFNGHASDPAYNVDVPQQDIYAVLRLVDRHGLTSDPESESLGMSGTSGTTCLPRRVAHKLNYIMHGGDPPPCP